MKRPDVGATLGMVRLEAFDVRHGRVVQRRVRRVLAVVRTPDLPGRPAELRIAGAEAIERHQVDGDRAVFPEGAHQLFFDRIGNRSESERTLINTCYSCQRDFGPYDFVQSGNYR